MDTDVVHEHDVASLQSRSKKLLRIGLEHLAGHRSFEHKGRGDTIMAQRSDEGDGFPIAVRQLLDEPLTLRRPTGETGNRRGDAGFGVEPKKAYHRADTHTELFRRFRNRGAILLRPHYACPQILRIRLPHPILASFPARILNPIRVRMGIPPDSVFSGNALKRKSADAGANTELSFAIRKPTQNTFVAFVVRRSTPTRMKVADNEQATMGVLAKCEADCVSPSRRRQRPDEVYATHQS